MARKTARRSPLEVLRETRRAWRRLSPFLDGSGRGLVLLSTASVLAGLMEAAVLGLVATVAATLSQGDTQIEADLGPFTLSAGITTMFAVGFGLALLRTGLQVLLAYLPARMSANATASLRRRLFEAFTGTSWSVQSSERDGHFQAMMGSHVSSASSAVITVGQGLSVALVFFTLLGTAFALSITTAIVLIVSSVGLFVGLQPLSRRLRKTAKLLSREQVGFSGVVQDITRMAEETQVFGASPSYHAGVLEMNEKIRAPLVRTRFLSRLVPVLYQSAALFLLLVALVAISFVGSDDFVALGAVVLLLVRSMNYGQQVLAALTRLDEVIPFMDRLRDTLDDYERNRRQDGPDPLPSVESIGMQGVSFAYKKEPVLSGIDFEVRRGEAVGIVGPSGAGKSTLVQLLLRLREPDEGVLCVNGKDATSFRRTDWQQRVAYVPQTPQLIDGTVADNIRFHRPEITDEQVEQAARRAHLHDEILSWSDGYDTVVGQRMSAVSGGQRQRLCIARALAGQPDVLVLDEPTSALDVRSEMLVGDSLRDIKGGVTMFLVAHRLSTLSICQRVMVVVDGRLQAFDEPAVLAERNPFYQDAVRITRERSVL